MPKLTFAALRFTEDENLIGRVYWYLAEFPVCAGEAVFAPVGPHDRLQKGRVERVRVCAEEEAPYDVRLIKRVAARADAPALLLGGEVCTEFGGARYDSRHFTAYHVLVYAEKNPEDADMVGGYGLDAVFVDPKMRDRRIYEGLILGHGTLLVGGEGQKICAMLLHFLKGGAGARETLGALGFREEELGRLFDALTRRRR